MLSKKVFVGLILTACVVCWSSKSVAQGVGASNVQTAAGPANFGIYNWDESLEAWVLLYSGYDEFYVSESPGEGEYLVDPVPIPNGGLGGGGDVDVIGLRSRRAASALLDNEEDDEEPKELEKVVVTGVRPSMIEGGLLSVLWRGSGLGELFGQRSASKKAVPAPKRDDIDQVTCDFPLGLKEAAATKVAAHYGIKPNSGNTGSKLTIKWRTGTEETYVNLGMSGGFAYMRPVPGTCKDA